jgi:hypothetical protein
MSQFSSKPSEIQNVDLSGVTKHQLAGLIKYYFEYLKMYENIPNEAQVALLISRLHNSDRTVTFAISEELKTLLTFKSYNDHNVHLVCAIDALYMCV